MLFNRIIILISLVTLEACTTKGSTFISIYPDAIEQKKIQEFLKKSKEGQEIVWINSKTEVQYILIPEQWMVQHDGQWCRNYSLTAVRARGGNGYTDPKKVFCMKSPPFYKRQPLN
ncbi:Uncharacterised protein [Candidatus Venteria ishoeyi]|uniref:Uncharacterized protein n=1 Tax=Candidatus Venteria ishoeyi TaxID=1899563 RepID=A0A1H6F6X4_9GAMM|nr:Uncharacterised protein [Candidatus Venteria ishoeyi]